MLFLSISFSASILNLSCKGSCIKREQPILSSASTKDKFNSIRKWLPEEINTILAIDTYKLSDLKLTTFERLKNSHWLKLFIGANLLDLKSEVGLMVVAMSITNFSDIKGPIFFLQGGFHQNLMLSKIESQAKQDGIKIKIDKYKKHSIYSEFSNEENRKEYAFSPIDSGIIVMAKTDDIKWIIDTKRKKDDISEETEIESPIWGYIKIVPNLKQYAPEPWNSISEIDLSANIKADISAKIIITTFPDSNNTQLISSLEGLKALEAIQKLDDISMLEAIEMITITEENKKIIINIPEELNLINRLLNNTKEVSKETEPDETETTDTIEEPQDEESTDTIPDNN